MNLGHADDEWVIEQKLALIQELGDATRLIELGIASLHELSGSNDFSHGGLQLLSQGIERLVKLTLIVGQSAAGKPLMTPKEMKKSFRHGIDGLHAAVLEMVDRVSTYRDRPIVIDDLQFMRDDHDLKRIIRLLSDFSQRDRYYQLNVVLDPTSADPDMDPQRIWGQLETDFLKRRPALLEHLTEIPSEELHRTINQDVTRVLDRYLRAISRMWFLGALGPSGPQYASGCHLTEITLLRDEQLGHNRSLSA